jgi:hypothetical protein
MDSALPSTWLTVAFDDSRADSDLPVPAWRAGPPRGRTSGRVRLARAGRAQAVEHSSSSPAGVSSAISTSSSRNRAAIRRPDSTDTSSSHDLTQQVVVQVEQLIRRRIVRSRTTGRSDEPGRTRDQRDGLVGRVDGSSPGNVNSPRISRSPRASSVGSFVVQP